MEIYGRYDEAMNADPKLQPDLYRIGQQVKGDKVPLIVPFDCEHFPAVLLENYTDPRDPLRLFAFE